MTRLGCPVLIVFCAVIGALADPECGDNEYLDNCPVECAADYCPRSEEEALQKCPSAPNPCPPPACKCRINFRRVSADNKTCISTRECSPFDCSRPNEEFNSCPPYCPSDSCSQATPDGNCPTRFGRIGTLLICSPKCRCIKNYWRQNGVCIPYAECPQNQAPAAVASASVDETPISETPVSDTLVPETPAPDAPVPESPAPDLPASQEEPDNTPQGDISYTEDTLPHASAYAEASEECASPLEDPECGDSEYLDNCPVDCAADYCPRSEEEALQNCPSAPNPCPPPACKCRINFRRVSADNKTCIPTRECSPFDCSRPNEEFNSCPPYCPSDSCSQATPDGNCPTRFGRIGTLLICSPKCRCIKNYWRQNGVCVPYAECPQNQAPAAVASASVDETPISETPVSDTPVPETPAPDALVPESPAPDLPASQEEPDNTPQGDISYTEYKLPHASACTEASEECASPLEDETCSGPNEEYVLEKRTCPPEFCSSLTARIICEDQPPPQPGCACKAGFFRLNATEPCIDMCDCPRMSYLPDCLGIFY